MNGVNSSCCLPVVLQRRNIWNDGCFFCITSFRWKSMHRDYEYCNSGLLFLKIKMMHSLSIIQFRVINVCKYNTIE